MSVSLRFLGSCYRACVCVFVCVGVVCRPCRRGGRSNPQVILSHQLWYTADYALDTSKDYVRADEGPFLSRFLIIERRLTTRLSGGWGIGHGQRFSGFRPTFGQLAGDRGSKPRLAGQSESGLVSAFSNLVVRSYLATRTRV